MKQPRIPTNYPRISIESEDAKGKIKEISEATKESLKEIVVRLIDDEHEKIVKKGGK
jgi:hypothetical protein